MANKISQLHGGVPFLGKDFGVEVELEGPDIYHRCSSHLSSFEKHNWIVTSDGSLRDGVEFVSAEPVPHDDVALHTENVYNILVDKDITFRSSDRTGVHTHMNVNDFDSVDLVKFLVCYYILEEALVSLCGEKRQGNHFCLRAVDAEFIIHNIYRAISDRDISSLGRDQVRYSALNLNSLFKFGTVEFRAIHTTENFHETIPPITDILYQLKQNSLSFSKPRDILEYFSGEGAFQVVTRLVGDNRLLLDQPDIEEKITRGVRLAQEFGYLPECNKADFCFIRPKRKSKSTNYEWTTV